MTYDCWAFAKSLSISVSPILLLIKQSLGKSSLNPESFPSFLCYRKCIFITCRNWSYFRNNIRNVIQKTCFKAVSQGVFRTSHCISTTFSFILFHFHRRHFFLSLSLSLLLLEASLYHRYCLCNLLHLYSRYLPCLHFSYLDQKGHQDSEYSFHFGYFST